MLEHREASAGSAPGQHADSRQLGGERSAVQIAIDTAAVRQALSSARFACGELVTYSEPCGRNCPVRIVLEHGLHAVACDDGPFEGPMGRFVCRPGYIVAAGADEFFAEAHRLRGAARGHLALVANIGQLVGAEA